MCGIIGMYGAEGLTIGERDSLEAGMRWLERRGPDGEGRYEDGAVWLGHRRLAILDPSAGAQPWRDAGSGVVVTYNGELYNFRELREELEALGHVFRSECDTEVLVRSYVEWGRGCLRKLEGIFAFGLWDPRERGIWLVRDRLGVKPLYYAETGSGLVFASSVAALLEVSGVGRAVDRVALAHYFLTIRTSLGERTLLRDIRSLEAGTALWKGPDGPVAVQRYWELPVVAAGERAVGELGEWAAEARARLDRVVRRQLISDVPVGGFLSGGLDSSILLSAILGSGEAELAAYSIGYDRPGYEEWEHVRTAGRFHGVEVEEVHLEEGGYAKDWEALVGFKGLPLSTPNEVPIRRLAERFKERYTVAMTGEGADELFGGYAGPTFCAFDYDRAQSGEAAVAAAALQRGYGTTEFHGRLEHFFRVNRWIDLDRQRSVLPGLEEACGDRVLAWYGGELERTARCTTLDAYLHLHARVNLEGLLSRLDSSTMYGGVEGRVPFTDPGLVEWLAHLPDRAKMALRADATAEAIRERNSFELAGEGFLETKRLLRAGYAGRVPASILERPKMSFPVPFLEWLEGPLREPFATMRRESRLVGELGGTALREGAVDGMLAWPLMNLVIWERCCGIEW